MNLIKNEKDKFPKYLKMTFNLYKPICHIIFLQKLLKFTIVFTKIVETNKNLIADKFQKVWQFLIKYSYLKH